MLHKALLLIFSFFVLLSVFSFILNAPLLIAYIKSDSMSPTLNKNDLVFINIFDRNFEPGDIVVFSSNGEWICHRIVKETAEGYITKGDKNIVTDQFGGKEIVAKEKIVGKILSFNGNPLSIPLGNGVEVLEGTFAKNKLILFFLLSLAGLLLLSRGEKKRKGKKYLKIKTTTLFAISSLLLVTMFSLANVVAFEKRTISYGTTSAGGLREDWVLPGEIFSRKIEFENKGSYPYFYRISSESPNLKLENTGFVLYPGERRVLKVEVHAPEDTNLHTEKISVAKYIPLLPIEIIDTLSIHPYLPILVMDLEIALILFAVYFFGNFENEVIKIRKRWKT
ncbi:MAG: signal peptidase I [Archaeoglobaceae archaeon]